MAPIIILSEHLFYSFVELSKCVTILFIHNVIINVFSHQTRRSISSIQHSGLHTGESQLMLLNVQTNRLNQNAFADSIYREQDQEEDTPGKGSLAFDHTQKITLGWSMVYCLQWGIKWERSLIHFSQRIREVYIPQSQPCSQNLRITREELLKSLEAAFSPHSSYRVWTGGLQSLCFHRAGRGGEEF